MRWADKGCRAFGRWISSPETLLIDLDAVVSPEDSLLTVLVAGNSYVIATGPETDWRLKRCVSPEAKLEALDVLTFREHVRRPSGASRVTYEPRSLGLVDVDSNLRGSLFVRGQLDESCLTWGGSCRKTADLCICTILYL